jgi:hypothetical protein
MQSVLISGTWATVELHAEATAKGGWAFDNQYCWLLEFRHGLVQVCPVSLHQLKRACAASATQEVASLSHCVSERAPCCNWPHLALQTVRSYIADSAAVVRLIEESEA